ncbi:MAG: hypothetical protein H6835_01425 [Planctomycetes bacterium]|nr:hypothetical protein [Planctomycetota bacterium]
MSDTLRIGLVAEGPGDHIVIEAFLSAVLDRDFVLTSLQPEASASFGPRGSGWTGVYKWCRDTKNLGGGSLSGDQTLFLNLDLVIVHLDADVAGFDYPSGRLEPLATDAVLPCEKQCPPAGDSVDALRDVALTWMGESTMPARTVFCTPSKSMDTWVLASLFPNDSAVVGPHPLECLLNTKTRLEQQPKRTRIRGPADLRQRRSELVSALPRIRSALIEADRFCRELQATLA